MKLFDGMFIINDHIYVSKQNIHLWTHIRDFKSNSNV